MTQSESTTTMATSDNQITTKKALSNAEIKRLKGIGHGLKPVVIIGNNGVSEGVVEEVKRALADHELIKIKIPASSKQEREVIAQNLAAQTQATLIQGIGRMALLFKPNPNANPKLSNLADID